MRSLGKFAFPENTEESQEWEPTIFIKPLHSKVLAVARTRLEGAWAAYCGPVPGMNHYNEYWGVLRHGAKLDEDVARVMFPYFEEVPYAP